ncbi:MAG: signal peptidase I [Rickettsiales bacterium]|jgi:signal peptidase I|nr:signal peptidase I [Rickettsiales bacterium]
MSKKYKRGEGSFGEWISTIIWAGIIAILFRSFLLEPFNIPSGSMIPTLHVGDHIFVQKWSYGFSRYSFPFGSWKLWEGRFWEKKPVRGDIIVFRTPDNTTDYVKRLIGMPGDSIQVRAGRLYINNEQIKREYKGRYVIAILPKMLRDAGFQRVDSKLNHIMVIKGNEIFEDNKPADYKYTVEYKDDAICRLRPDECIIHEGSLYEETLPNGRKYEIVKITDNGRYDNTPVYQVPTGHYFFMGDDRDLSADSRAGLGFVPADNLMGRVWFIFYSHNYYAPLPFVWDWKYKLRFERFGRIVK